MEKITKEELKDTLGLSEKELEKIAGGSREAICQQSAQEKFDSCMAQYAMKSQLFSAAVTFFPSAAY